MYLLFIGTCMMRTEMDKKTNWFASRDGSIVHIKIDVKVCSLKKRSITFLSSSNQHDAPLYPGSHLTGLVTIPTILHA